MSWPQIMCRKLQQHATNIYHPKAGKPKNCKAWLSKWSSGAQPFHVNPKHHGKKTGIVSRLEERGAEQKWRRKEGMGCALPTPGPQERSAFHIKELEERRLEQGHLLRASFPKARSMLPADRAQEDKKIGRGYHLFFLFFLGGGAEGLGGAQRRPRGREGPKALSPRVYSPLVLTMVLFIRCNASQLALSSIVKL